MASGPTPNGSPLDTMALPVDPLRTNPSGDGTPEASFGGVAIQAKSLTGAGIGRVVGSSVAVTRSDPKSEGPLPTKSYYRGKPLVAERDVPG